MYKSLAFILSIALILALVLCVYLNNSFKAEITRANLFLLDLQNARSNLVVFVLKAGAQEQQLSLLSNKVSQLTRTYEAQLTALQKRLALYAGTNANASPTSTEALGYQRYAAGLASLIESQEMLQNTRARLEDQQVNAVYASFLKNTLTTMEDNRIITELLVDRYLLDWKKQIELMNPTLNRIDRLALIKKTENEQAEIDQKIKNRLGDELYAQYIDIQQTQKAREFVVGFNSRLTVNNIEPLSDIQRKRLIALAAEAIEKMHARPDYIDFEALPFDQLSQREITTFKNYHLALNSWLLNQTKTLLKSAQRDIMKTYLDQNLEQQLTSLSFTLNMFQSKPKK